MITYQTKLTDTHNAMNTGNGIFTAPFLGAYGFVFYADFFCSNSKQFLFVDHNNGGRNAIFRCYNGSNYSSRSIYFAMSLKQGDTVGIFTDVQIWLGFHRARFTGFLLQKN